MGRAMTLFEALQQLYPGSDPLLDYRLQDDGRGAYIAQWNLSAPQPTGLDLAAFGIVEGHKTMSAIAEWAELNRKLLDQAQDIIDATARPRRLGQANDIPAAIAGTADGEQVADSGWTKERAASVNTMWVSFAAWLEMPLDGVALAPIQILSMRDT
jgi:hypothetical protein